MEVDYRNVGDLEWFQNGPTTHLTDDGERSLCGVEKPDHVDAHPVEGGEYVCKGCANAAEDL